MIKFYLIYIVLALYVILGRQYILIWQRKKMNIQKKNVLLRKKF